MKGGAVLPMRWVIAVFPETTTTVPGPAPKEEESDNEVIMVGGVSFSPLAQSIGAREWYDTSKHPPPPYRAQALLDGLYVRLYLRYSDGARLPGEYQSDFQAIAEGWQKEYRLSPPLPVVGVTDVFEWSRKETEQLLSEEQNIAEFPKP